MLGYKQSYECLYTLVVVSDYKFIKVVGFFSGVWIIVSDGLGVRGYSVKSRDTFIR